MKKNMGGIDRIVRIFLVLVIAGLFWKGIIVGTLAYVLLSLAIVLLLTSFVNFCPLYKLIGLNTLKKSNK
ncbi:DUF2892 domain-containing protein [uncultured Tenacibaculum sp.]|uniref:YgaP family membrane protein n=1 Tax=uncultured Tenacibaculum sp. TaxID=174713 RepID=UPI00262DF373|nr:DUF2892 domain-containing protein [uncultured Tenacibaculum sp.]